MSFWSSLGLAWKYTFVFGLLIAATLVVGAIKMLFTRSKLEKMSIEKSEKLRLDNPRLAFAQRTKDEGDLFGVRALEAGYFGGVSQSRPTSTCTSRNTSISGNTLVGTSSTPKLISPAASVTQLPRVKTNDSGKSLPSILRNKSSSLKLQPSEAELNGRKNHGGVDMSMDVPPSPAAPESTFYPATNRNGQQSSILRVSPDPLAPVRKMHDPTNQPVVERVPRMAPFRSESDLNTKSMAVSVDFTIGGSSMSDPASPTNWPPSPSKIISHYVPQRSQDESRSLSPAGSQKYSTQSEFKTQPSNAQIPNYTFPTNVYMTRQSLYSSESDKSSTSSRHSRNLSDSTIDRGFPFPGHTTTMTDECSSRSTSAQSRRYSFSTSTLETSLPIGSPDGSHLSEFFEAYFNQSHSDLDKKLDLSGGAGVAKGSRLSEMTRAPSPGMMPPRLSPKNSKRGAPVGRAL
ncbi:uncharacterized protein J3D65DRAFT_663998 [Phyllosticta citribraziliensis]|uniref:Uncharacterized protein n=1 Tax=Phyllosticta citribraziliensis TaxID=989973 RepID=A0ABR1MDV9_9PEZI